MIDEGSFWLGLFFGFAIAGIGGWILGRIRLARNSMHAADRPLSVQTGKTPRQVLATAADGATSCLIWSIVFVGFVIAVVTFLYWMFFTMPA